MTDLSHFDLNAKFAPEAALLDQLVADAALDPALRDRITAKGADLVRRIRAEAKPTLMEHFLSEYGLSTREGVALMCLAEAMLRVHQYSMLCAPSISQEGAVAALRLGDDPVMQPVGHMLSGDAQRGAVFHQAHIVDVRHF